jgi:CRISPR-associated protein Csb2
MSKLDSSVPTISGRDENGKPLRDPTHGHAFFLPEDHDGDGFIDHLVLYARDGLARSVQRATERLTRLWLAEGSSRPTEYDADEERGRREWRVALEGFGDQSMFPDSHLLRPSAAWVSATPYLRPWHTKSTLPERETPIMLAEECRRRGLPNANVEFDRDFDALPFGRSVAVGSSRRRVLHFHRFRSRRGLIQPDRSGAALRLIFAEPIMGPLAFGFGCHYGLGLFRTE